MLSLFPQLAAPHRRRRRPRAQRRLERRRCPRTRTRTVRTQTLVAPGKLSVLSRHFLRGISRRSAGRTCALSVRTDRNPAPGDAACLHGGGAGPASQGVQREGHSEGALTTRVSSSAPTWTRRAGQRPRKLPTKPGSRRALHFMEKEQFMVLAPTKWPSVQNKKAFLPHDYNNLG